MPTLAELEAVARGASPPPLDNADRERIGAARAVIEDAVASELSVYGVTTGFGQLASVRVPPADAARLQVNLLRSHAVGSGPPLAEEVVRGMLFLLAGSLRRGHSGARVELVELVLGLLERGVVPVVPSRGSVGSSGDLAPLAHLGLVLIGEGEATVEGERLSGAQALERAGLRAGRAHRQGGPRADQRHAPHGRRRRSGRARGAAPAGRGDRRGGPVARGVQGIHRALDERLLRDSRPQPGPARVAARLRALLAGSEVVTSHADCGRVQDPYTLRCAPQVIGAIDDALRYVRRSARARAGCGHRQPADLPRALRGPGRSGDVLAGGNFHGQPLALPLDHLALALCELASFSERRIYALLSPSYAGLPPFLSPEPGLSSGLMIAQYAAAALVNECQVLSHPAGAGSIPTSAGTEDFNSMGALAALKGRAVVASAAHVIATELVCACQGLEFHRPLHTTPVLERAVEQVRALVPRLEEDRSLAGELAALADALRTGALTFATTEVAA